MARVFWPLVGLGSVWIAPFSSALLALGMKVIELTERLFQQYVQLTLYDTTIKTVSDVHGCEMQMRGLSRQGLRASMWTNG